MPAISSPLKAEKINKRDRPANITSLSLRQEQVLMLLARGYRNKVIADELGLSVNTVSCHIKQIFARLRVNSRAKAAVCYVTSRTSPIKRENHLEHPLMPLRLSS